MGTTWANVPKWKKWTAACVVVALAVTCSRIGKEGSASNVAPQVLSARDFAEKYLKNVDWANPTCGTGAVMISGKIRTVTRDDSTGHIAYEFGLDADPMGDVHIRMWPSESTKVSALREGGNLRAKCYYQVKAQKIPSLVQCELQQ